MTETDLPNDASAMLDALLAQDPVDAHRRVAESNREWQIACAQVARTPAGKRWLRIAMCRYNLTGSVFQPDFAVGPAAFADGRRSVLSDLINAAAVTSYNDTDED